MKKHLMKTNLKSASARAELKLSKPMHGLK